MIVLAYKSITDNHSQYVCISRIISEYLNCFKAVRFEYFLFKEKKVYFFRTLRYTQNHHPRNHHSFQIVKSCNLSLFFFLYNMDFFTICRINVKINFIFRVVFYYIVLYINYHKFNIKK